jgi:hypothetical protein
MIIINSFVPTTLINSESRVFVNEIFGYIEAKDSEELKYRMGYNEGEDGWLYNVEFESFELLNELKDYHGSYGYLMKVTVSESSDPRFPVEESFRYFEWNWILNEVDSFIEIDDKGNYQKQLNYYYDKREFENYELTSADKAVMLAYGFEHAFSLYDDIPDMSDFSDYIKNSKYYNSDAFEFLPIEMGADYFTEYTQEYVNTLYYDFLGVAEQPYDFLEHTRDDIYEIYPTLYVVDMCYKSYDNVGLVWRLDEQTDSTITITFFGDRCYLTPAVTMKYTYEINDGIPRLLSSEVVEDFGYEPIYIDFY